MSVVNALVTAGGIYLFYMLSSIAQEGIYSSGDRQKGETFQYPIFLVFAMCLGSAISSYLISLFTGSSNKEIVKTLKQIPQSQKPTEKIYGKHFNQEIIKNFVLISLTFISAMLTSNYALTQVSYPTQVLVKTAKMVPIVIGGLLIYKRTYPWYDYAGVFLVTSSLILFNLAKMGSKKDAANTLSGVLLCFLSLLCDGMTGPRQDFLNSKYKFTPTDHMLFTNFFACIPSFFAMLLLERTKPLEYMIRYPGVISSIALFCVCNTLGQIFIFRALTYFGALHLALITTTRKFFSVIASIFIFHHTLNGLQWLSVFGVFTGLIGQMYFKHVDKQKRHLNSS